MSETIQIWLFGGAYGLLAANMVFSFHLNNKLIRIETMFEVFGKKSAKLLHSPDNHLGLDSYLDKYIDQHYDMTMDEWVELKKHCEAIEHNNRATPDEKILAAFIAALCTHKLMRFGIKPDGIKYATHEMNIGK